MPTPTIHTFLFCLLPAFSIGIWEPKVDPVASPKDFQFHQIAVQMIQNHNDKLANAGVRGEIRFESFVEDWENMVREFRFSAQQIVGPIDEGTAIDVFLSEMWWVYGYVSVPLLDIEKAMKPIVPHTHRWVDPYGGTGYIALQIRESLGVEIHSWDRKPRHLQWVPMEARNATAEDYSSFDTFVLGYPCCIEECWQAVPRYTELETANYLIFLGEPRGHYCIDDDMWDVLCNGWDLRITHRILGGLPGSYHHIFVFSKKGANLPCDWPCDEGGVPVEGDSSRCACPVIECYDTMVVSLDQ